MSLPFGSEVSNALPMDPEAPVISKVGILFSVVSTIGKFVFGDELLLVDVNVCDSSFSYRSRIAYLPYARTPNVINPIHLKDFIIGIRSQSYPAN